MWVRFGWLLSRFLGCRDVGLSGHVLGGVACVGVVSGCGVPVLRWWCLWVSVSSFGGCWYWISWLAI